MNFLNSPGGIILRELGIGGANAPWNRGATGQGQPVALPMGGVPPIQEGDMQMLQAKRPRGLLNKLFSVMSGGMG